MKDPIFKTKFFTLLKEGISRKQILNDISAGVIVGIVALPLAIAFAIASGVSPDKGLVTAIIAGLIISVLGGSRVQIGGPTGAFIVIVYAIVQEHGVDGLIISTFMAGIMLVVMGIARLGVLLKYIPHPLIIGFTSGIAVVIFSSQIKDFFGLPIDAVPADFVEKWSLYAKHFTEVNYIAIIIAVLTVVISLNFNKISKKIPGSIVAIVLSTLAVYLFDLPVTTIETSFGSIPNHITIPSFPQFDFKTIQALLQPAFAIALLGGIESLLSAVVSDGMIGGRHRSNTELIAQGTANCASAIFGGIPATGAIARTATNVNNGGRTPIAGITHAIMLLLIMLIFAPLAKLIPMACLAGILVVVSYHMSEWRQFTSLLKGNKYDIVVLLVTFILTVVVDLVVAIQIGIVISSFIFMKRMSDSLYIQKVQDLFPRDSAGEKIFDDDQIILPKGVIMYEVSGALFFGAAQVFQDTISQIKHNPKVLIIRMRHVSYIDATGIFRLKELIKHFNSERVTVIISGAQPSVKTELEKGEIYTVLPAENMAANFEKAVIRSEEILKELKKEKSRSR